MLSEMRDRKTETETGRETHRDRQMSGGEMLCDLA